MLKLIKKFDIVQIFRSMIHHFVFVLLITFTVAGVSSLVFIFNPNNTFYSSTAVMANRVLITDAALSLIKSEIKSEEVFDGVISTSTYEVTYQELIDHVTVTINKECYGFNVSFESKNRDKTLLVTNLLIDKAVEACNKNTKLSQNSFFVKQRAHEASRVYSKTTIGAIIIATVLVFAAASAISYFIDRWNYSVLSKEDYRLEGIQAEFINIELKEVKKNG